ncbi:MAG TPA: hypothetical protein VND19_07890 [Acetobacteraceae bacterium]|nr:hypothetical protein [Acetobacteraceae bacterium]
MRAAVQAANAIGIPHVRSVEQPRFIRDFQMASEAAKRFLIEALALRPCSEAATTTRRASAVMQHLNIQAAANDDVADGQPNI